MYGLDRLERAAVKVWNGIDFSMAETIEIKVAYRNIRKRCNRIFQHVMEDEIRCLSLVQALVDFEAGNLTLKEYLGKIDHGSRSISGAEDMAAVLRERIAYHLALAAFAYVHIEPFRRVPKLVISAEFLRHMAALEGVLSNYDAITEPSISQRILAA